jgi:predicted phosphodiesterase
MNLQKFPSAKSIVVSGDIHGDFNQLVFKVCVQYQMRDTLLVVAGDCGFGFEQSGYYEDIARRNAKRLSDANNWIVFVRGNHDNPAYFDGSTFKHRRMMAVPDYTVIQACGHTILCVGGAISIDRSYRLEQWNNEQKRLSRMHPDVPDGRLAKQYYWADEAPLYDDIRLGKINEKFAIDIVITHSAPSFCQLQNKNFLMQYAPSDATLLDDVRTERETMDALYNRLLHDAHPLTHWYYGHFHQSWNCAIDGVMFSMLDVMEFREIR